MPDKKKETFEPPKAVDLEGKEITEDVLDDEALEDVAGGGNTCHTGISYDPAFE